jgi:hypothetical protein
MPETFHDFIKDVPPKDLPENVMTQLFAAFALEFYQCIKEAGRAQEPHIFFNAMRKGGSQYIWEFGVNDRVKPRTDAINWHGQNTSQWIYAGGIVLDDGQVSRNH